MVKDLRERTGAGMMDCKKALAESGGDIEKAIEYLRKKGIAAAAQEGGARRRRGPRRHLHPRRHASACWWRSTARPTSSPATRTSRPWRGRGDADRGDEPAYVVRSDEIPAGVLEKEKEIQRGAGSSRRASPRRCVDKIVDGQMEKCYESVCLAGPVLVKDEQEEHPRDAHRARREDRREHLHPPLRPLRGRRGPREEEGRLRRRGRQAG